MAKPKCGPSNTPEYTLCGNAFDNDYEDARPLFAKSGERVTCVECLEALKHARRFVGDKVPSDG